MIFQPTQIVVLLSKNPLSQGQALLTKLDLCELVGHLEQFVEVEVQAAQV